MEGLEVALRGRSLMKATGIVVGDGAVAEEPVSVTVVAVVLVVDQLVLGGHLSVVLAITGETL